MATSNRPEVPLKLLLIALAVGVLAAFLAVWYLNAKEAQLRRELTPVVEMRDAIVASQALLKGSVLSTSNLSVRSIPAEYLSREALTPADFDAVDGKILIQNVDQGNVILASYLALSFPKDFSDTIPLKRRAMTIQVDELNSINGFIRPGNRIDLFANLPGNALASEASEDGEGNSSSGGVIPILENVEVLATGQSAAREYEEQVRLLRGGYNVDINTAYTTLTLNVTPREAAILVTAKEAGDLLALLRNRNDQGGSQFSSLAPSDLLANAEKLAQDAQIREANAAVTGFVTDADGVIRTKDGVVLKNQNLIVAEDGTIMTKDGIILSGRGLTVNANGELVDADGNVVDPDTLTVAADGSIITADGRILSGEKALGLGTKDLQVVQNPDGTSSLKSADGTVITGLNINEDGMVVLADGTLVDPNDLVITSDGRIMTKDGRIVEGGAVGITAGNLTVNPDGSITTASGAVITGATLNDKGQLVLADGTVIDPDDLVINADGSVMTTSGKVLQGLTADTSAVDGLAGASGGALSVPAGQLTQNPDGSITTASGAVIYGATLNEKGQLVLADGTIVDPNDVIITADGRVITRSGQELEGVSADISKVAAFTKAKVYEIDYIVGGVSKDGVAEVKKIPVEDPTKGNKQ
ncbi:MAG: Flp pilus assembly protein CpaB [Cryomorphaceae bacterium]